MLLVKARTCTPNVEGIQYQYMDITTKIEENMPKFNVEPIGKYSVNRFSFKYPRASFKSDNMGTDAISLMLAAGGWCV